MKKLCVLLLALVVASSAFAQLTINGYERAWFTFDDAGNGSLANRWRMNMSFADPDGGNFGVWGRFQAGDFATAPALAYGYGWAKVLDGKLKVSAGKLAYYDYTVFCGVSDTQLGNLYTDLLYGDGWTGLLVQAFPIEGLNVGVSYEPGTVVSLGDFGANLKYTLADIGDVIVSANFADATADSFFSATFNWAGTAGVSAAAGFMYGGGVGYKTAVAEDMGIFANINYKAEALSAQVVPFYNLTASTIYVEGYVGYSAAPFTFNVIGAYDSGAYLGQDYFFGLEANYAVGKANFVTGCYYGEADGLSIPLVLKVGF